VKLPISQARIKSARQQQWLGLAGSSLSLALSKACQAHPGLTLLVARSSHQAHLIHRDLTLLGADDLPLVLFPDRETLPYDTYSAHPDIASDRLSALSRMAGLDRGIIIASAPALLQRLPPRPFVLGRAIDLAPGQTLSISRFREQLLQAGYEKSDQVYQSGQFSVRGSVIDLYPSGSPAPLRIDLFDEEIESIREFDPESQRSTRDLDGLNLVPAREYPCDTFAMDAFRKAFRYRFAVDTRKVMLYQDLRKGVHPQGLEHYLPLFFEQTDTLLDYLKAPPLLLLQEGCKKAMERFEAQTLERWEQRRHDVERPILEPAELYLKTSQQLDGWSAMPRLLLGGATQNEADPALFDTQLPPQLNLGDRQQGAGGGLEHFLDEFSGRVLFAADTPGRREYLSDALGAMNVDVERFDSWQAFVDAPGRLGLAILPIEEGFVLGDELAVLTESQLFGGRARTTEVRERAARDPESIIRDLTDLAEGAPVVHEDHGVGRYQGLEVLDIDQRPAEFLMLEYADGDKLYVPVSSLHLISRYTGASTEQAPMHRLGGEQWEKVRKRAAEKVRDVAAELLDLYARRQAREGFSFELDQRLYVEFCAGFPFEETLDQQNAIDAVLADMASTQPMDRVVCGDVGFGKTEVALRAAFMAVQGGRQVALLVPTTLLAQQHYATFSDRFADWPVRIELLSRFRSAKEVDTALERLNDGQVDIVIGTHRLLQRDIAFDRLGLVIIDEEQRFGVRQKERLKQLRSEVDLLTLTATPIPRTLNMAMSGIRDLSIIATPPARRMAVKTLLVQWDNAILREAIQRELQRGGQVFFLHNEVRDIERIAREVTELVPEARVEVAHGQMKERELERVMLDFYRQRFNVLVCTTIIENGIDVPTANTIIVHRADRFGLAQLHQLRGRVGRSHHLAYAYLVVPDQRAMTSDACKRLDAIASMEELGAGFTLATHDLEIRGAGELLGEGQSGQIQQIGFSLYSEYLRRAVSALQAGIEPDEDLTREQLTEVEMHLPALIPEDYLADVHARLTLYKRIASAGEERELRELQVEMIDRFGLLPEPIQNLFEVTRLRQRARSLGISRIDVGEQGGSLEFQPDTVADPDRLLSLMTSQPGRYRMAGPRRLLLRLDGADNKERLLLTAELLDELAPRLDEHS
jgi:transcription-repair coupling factor (superfamily II helicase)